MAFNEMGAVMKDGGRFTLIEMLIVVSIITVLVALLLPTLKRATDSAYTLKCTNNLSQIYTVTVLYANDNHGFFPPVNYPDVYKRGGKWATSVAVYAGIASATPADYAAMYNAGGLPGSIFECPQSEKFTTWGGFISNNYGVNYKSSVNISGCDREAEAIEAKYSLGAAWRWGCVGIPIARMKQPQHTMFVMDIKEAGNGNDYMGGIPSSNRDLQYCSGEARIPRHGQGSSNNFLFYDGRARAVTDAVYRLFLSNRFSYDSTWDKQKWPW